MFAPTPLQKHFAMPSGSLARPPDDYVPWGVNYQDLKPPGVILNVPNPSFPYFGPTVGTAYYAPNAVNKPVPPNLWNGDVPNWQRDPWARRMNAAWYEVSHQNITDEHYQNRDFSQFSVPHTGFSKLKDFVPGSTRGCLLPTAY